ncbi:AI-2E family transporter [Cryobacterium sp. MDB2-33-2]|uniref:AI-2E family transporter n=1 Tax=Cryobacterium sp. MDB2-33-2 TaxID=1259179 RepID=UPI0010691D76|nr:AI-2E family transporter [Cryobacterium sp. MDB2-33-2]TFC08059.1 AI-2E family transporter [Cryobacterium sp. MDB2-33-2]
MTESAGRPGWSALLTGRRRRAAPIGGEPGSGPGTGARTAAGERAGAAAIAVVSAPPNGVDENVPAGIRLAGAWSWRLLAVFAVIAVFLFVVVQLRLIVIPLLIAVLVSSIVAPFVSFLVRHRWPKGLAIAVAVLTTLLVPAALITLAATQLAGGLSGLSDRLAGSYGDLKALLLASPLHLTEPQINDYLQQALAAIQADSQVFLSGALSLGTSLGHGLTGLLLTLFSLLFLLIDGPGIWAWIVRIFPRRARAAIDGAGQAGWTTLGNFAKVQILVASIDALGIGLGAFLLGVPLAIPIGVLVFLGSFIPIVGAVATGAVAVVIALLFNSWPIALAMLGVVLLVQQVEGHVLQPLIMGTAVKVHPLGVVLVVAAGSLLAGIPGALFAVPVAAVLNVMINYIQGGSWRADLPDVPRGTESPLWRTVPQRPSFTRTRRNPSSTTTTEGTP